MNMMNKKIMNMIEFEIGHGDGHDHGDGGGDGVDDDSYATHHDNEDDFILLFLQQLVVLAINKQLPHCFSGDMCIRHCSHHIFEMCCVCEHRQKMA